MVCARYNFLSFFVLLVLATALAANAYPSGRDEPPTAYGLKYYRSDNVARPDRQAPLLRSAPEAEAFRLAVEQSELEGGPYNPGLGETLIGQAYYLAEHGDYESAISSARRGLHVIRINEGLYDSGQLPIVDKLIDWYLLSDDREAADEAWEYRHFLAGRVWPAGSVESVEAQAADADWTLKLWLDNTSELRKRVYLVYRDLDAQRTGLLLQREAHSSSLQQLTYAQLGFLYAAGLAQFGPAVDFATNYGRAYASDPTQEQLSMEDRQLKILQDGAYSRGRVLLQQLLDWLAAQPAVDAAARTEALLQMGDWHIWNYREARAQEYYLLAWQQLPGAGAVAAPAQELPSRPWFYPGERLLPTTAEPAAVEVVVSIAADGRVTAASAANPTAAAQPQAGRLLRWLRQARYRPQLEEGRPVASRELQRTYRLHD